MSLYICNAFEGEVERSLHFKNYLINPLINGSKITIWDAALEFFSRTLSTFSHVDTLHF